MLTLLTSDKTIDESFDFVSFASLICKIWIINYSAESQFGLGIIQSRRAGRMKNKTCNFHSYREGKSNKNRRGKCLYAENSARGSTYSKASRTLEKEVHNLKHLFEIQSN